MASAWGSVGTLSCSHVAFVYCGGANPVKTRQGAEAISRLFNQCQVDYYSYTKTEIGVALADRMLTLCRERHTDPQFRLIVITHRQGALTAYFSMIREEVQQVQRCVYLYNLGGNKLLMRNLAARVYNFYLAYDVTHTSLSEDLEKHADDAEGAVMMGIKKTVLQENLGGTLSVNKSGHWVYKARELIRSDHMQLGCLMEQTLPNYHIIVVKTEYACCDCFSFGKRCDVQPYIERLFSSHSRYENPMKQEMITQLSGQWQPPAYLFSIKDVIKQVQKWCSF